MDGTGDFTILEAAYGFEGGAPPAEANGDAVLAGLYALLDAEKGIGVDEDAMAPKPPCVEFGGVDDPSKGLLTLYFEANFANISASRPC